jgi:cell division protein FtsB
MAHQTQPDPLIHYVREIAERISRSSGDSSPLVMPRSIARTLVVNLQTLCTRLEVMTAEQNRLARLCHAQHAALSETTNQRDAARRTVAKMDDAVRAFDAKLAAGGM